MDTIEQLLHHYIRGMTLHPQTREPKQAEIQSLANLLRERFEADLKARHANIEVPNIHCPYKVYYAILRARDIDNQLTKLIDKTFAAELEQDILESGIRKPIHVTYGYSGQEHVCSYLGGTRLSIAQKHDMEIKAIVSSKIVPYPHKAIDILETADQVRFYFKEPPTWVKFGKTHLLMSTPGN